MTFPPSKKGDEYNYSVAAYLKVKGLPDLGSKFDLTEASIDAAPKRISADIALFETPISFDIIASTAEWDMLVECKHFEHPKPLSMKSQEFLESMGQFLSSEPLKKLGYKDYKYLFITNADIDHLTKSLRDMKNSDDDNLDEFLNSIKNVVHKKWNHAQTEKVTRADLRRCIDDTRIFRIEDGTLALLRENEQFESVFNKLVEKIGTKIPDLPPNLPSSTKFALFYQGDEFVDSKWNSYPVFVSKKFVEWIAATKLLDKNVIEIPFESIPDSKNIIIKHSDDFSTDQVATALSTCINSNLQSMNSKISVVISTSNRLYLFNPIWLFEKASELKESNYKFNLKKITQRLNLPFGSSLVRIAIQESYRLVNGMSYDIEYFVDD